MQGPPSQEPAPGPGHEQRVGRLAPSAPPLREHKEKVLPTPQILLQTPYSGALFPGLTYERHGLC